MEAHEYEKGSTTINHNDSGALYFNFSYKPLNLTCADREQMWLDWALQGRGPVRVVEVM